MLDSADKIGMRNDNLFLIFILSLTAAVLLVSGEAKVFLGDSAILAMEVDDLQKDLKQAELREALVAEQVFDYQQSVLKVLGTDPAPKNWAQMNLLSQSRSIASVEPMDRSGLLLAAAKEKFNSAKYLMAAEKFGQLTASYPVSPVALEARFLRAESLFLAGQLDACVEQIDEMMTQFPDHPMTGFLMLRLSQIMKQRSRNLEAREILQMIQRGFPSEKTLVEQAQVLEGEFRIL